MCLHVREGLCLFVGLPDAPHLAEAFLAERVHVPGLLLLVAPVLVQLLLAGALLLLGLLLLRLRLRQLRLGLVRGGAPEFADLPQVRSSKSRR